MRQRTIHRDPMRARSQRGSALLLTIMITSILATLSLALLNTTLATQSVVQRSEQKLSAFYSAEAGMDEAVAILQKSGKAGLMAAAYPRTMGGMQYSVRAIYGDVDPTLQDDRIELLSSGNNGRTKSSIEMVVRTIPSAFYTFAVFGYDYLNMNSNSYVDSYDSASGTYASQVSGGHAHSAETVGSNGNITLASNSKVYGNAQPGPAGTVSAAGSATITGSTTPATSPVVFPAVTVPSIASSGAYTVRGSRTLGPGNLHYSSMSFNSNSSLTLVGPATMVLDSFDQRSNTTFTVDARNGPVKIYGTGNFQLRSNSSLSSLGGHARDISVYLTGNNISGGNTISINSNSDFVGTIYAPNVDLSISSNFHLYGSVMARRFTLSSNSQVHFDEDLLRDTSNGPPTIQKISWRRLTPELARTLGAP